jgi:hypothetical protein
MNIVWHFARTMLCMLFHGLIKCTFACQIAWYTILYTQYDVMHVHCLNMQRNQGHVNGIEEACAWNTFIIDHVICYVRAYLSGSRAGPLSETAR